MGKIIDKIENMPLTAKQWIGTAWIIMILRMAFEGFSGNGLDFYNFQALFLHPILFYFSLILTIAIFLYLLTGKEVKKILNLALIGLVIILFLPFIDFLASGGKGDVQSHYFFVSLPELIRNYFTFFGPHLESGATYGVRVQAILAMIFTGVYIFHVTRKKWKALLGVIGAYTIFFLYGALPSIIGSFSYLPRNPWSVGYFEILNKFAQPRNIFAIVYDSGMLKEIFSIEMSIIILPLVFGQLFILLLIWNKTKFIEFMKNLRYLRLLFHYAALVIGIVIGMWVFDSAFDLTLYGILTFIALGIATTCVWIFSLTINDQNDMEIDSISNQDRLLVRKIFSPQEFEMIGNIAFILAIMASLAVGYDFFVLILVALLLSVIYSVPPFRMRRFPLISSFIIALGTASLTLVGYRLFSVTGTFFEFPINMFMLLIFVVALVINIKDIKDIKGDKPNGVYTIPTVFGDRKGKIIISLLFVLSYLLFPIILLIQELIITALVFSLLTVLVINTKQIHEKFVFVIYCAFLLVTAFIVF